VLGERGNSLQMAATWFKSLQDVRTQELAVRLDSLMTSGDQKMAAGDYSGAELDYDRVEVGLRSFPYQFDWGTLPQEVAGKRLEARAQARKAQDDRDRASREQAHVKAKEQADLQEQALRDKVDELVRRAKVAYDRKDYKRAEVDAWNAYELDRRREDARSLYLAARREGHIEFDDRYREERLERLARVNEEIHKSLIPQSEILVYPEDWQRRSLRQPRQIGNQKAEAWVAALNDRMSQRITFEFQDQSFEDVVNFLRQVTGVNIVIAPEVTAAGAGGTVTLKVKDMRFGDALKWILELTNLHMALQDQAIFISNKPVTGAIVLKMYDVTDLISPVRDFPGRELAYNAGGGSGSGINMFANNAQEDTKGVDPAELVDFIRKNVAPKSWDVEGAGIEQRSGSTLFVSQTPEVHDQVEQLLANLRNQQSLQVSVNVRLLDVRKNFFEEIGFSYIDPMVPTNMDILTSSSQTVAPGVGQGYIRENKTISYQGSLHNEQLPPNQTQAAYNAFGGIVPRGLYVESSHSIFNFFNADQINAIFSAVEEESDLQVLQHPLLTCFNGQRANCAFMNQYAYIADYDVVSSALDPKIQVLTFGNILDVRPVVSSDHKYITMEIRPASVLLQGVFTEILQAPRILTTGNASFFVGVFDYPLELPNVLVRTMRSSVMLPDKSSLLIGGFEHSLRQRTHTGIPFLSHIPFLGRLFSRNGVYDENHQLYMLLNAEIIDLREKEALQ
jgi:type II secretory pathway component GspD/PulD (secretin)